MSFLDYILSSFGIHEKTKKPEETKSFHLRKNYSEKHHSQKIAIFCPKSLDEMLEVAKFLSSNQPSLLNLSYMEQTSKQRGLDFVFGALVGTKYNFSKIGESLYVFAPEGTQILNRTDQNV